MCPSARKQGIGQQLAVVAIVLMMAQGALAQGLEEIVVVAQKREQNLQDVPMSVSAIDAEEIRTLSLIDSGDIAMHTPGMSWGGSENRTRPQIFMRGVGNSDFQSAANSPIAVYQDGVYQGNGFGLGALLMDLNRVEILRGPQGTLWGKNTTAGLINFVPNKAEVGTEANGRAALGVAGHGSLDAQGAIGFPLSEKAAGRLAVNRNVRDGALQGVGPGVRGDLGGWDWTAARANLLVEPADDLSIDTTVTFSELDGESKPGKSLGLFDPANPVVFVPFPPFAFGNPCPLPDAGQLGTRCSDIEGFVNTPDLHELAPESNGMEDVENTAIDVKIDKVMGNATLTYVAAYNDSARQVFIDTDGSPSGLLENSTDDDFGSFSHELRLSLTAGDRLYWVAGLYRYSDELEVFQQTTLPFAFGLAGRVTNLLTDSDTTAVFGEVSYLLADGLEFTAGGRWTTDERQGGGRIYTHGALRGEFNSPGYTMETEFFENSVFPDLEEDWQEFSGRLSLSYKATDDVTLWGTVARGFKGGEVNSGADDASVFTISDPEFVTSFETGVKARLWEDTFEINASAYYYAYEDKQAFAEILSSQGIPLSILTNAGELTIKGIDGEITWLPAHGLRIASGFAYIDSVFDELEIPGELVPPRTGNTTSFTPELSFDVIVSYEWSVGGGGSIMLQADAVYSDDIFFSNNNQALVSQKAYWLTGARIEYASPDERWDLSVWARNLADEKYSVGGFDFSFFGTVFQFAGDPRTVGATVNVYF